MIIHNMKHQRVMSPTQQRPTFEINPQSIGQTFMHGQMIKPNTTTNKSLASKQRAASSTLRNQN